MTANKVVIWWESLCGRKTPYDAFWVGFDDIMNV